MVAIVLVALVLLLALVAPQLVQMSAALRNARADRVESFISTSPILRLWSGALPANVAAADAGSNLAEGTLPSNWMADASSGTASLSGTWTLTGQAAAGLGTNAVHWRLYTSGGTCHMQGTLGTAFTLVTSALTAANGNVLTFAATTGAAVGQKVSGTGIVTGTTVVAVSGTTVTLSHTSTAGVSSSTTITFGYDLNIQNVNIANGQTVTVSAFDIVEGNA